MTNDWINETLDSIFARSERINKELDKIQSQPGGDPDYWRWKYGHVWKEARDRVEHVKYTILKWFPKLEVKEGFLATSTQRIFGTPKGHEKGEPDLWIYSRNKLVAVIDVTGSWFVLGMKDVWVRPDKVEWATNHPSPKSWTWAVYLDQDRVVPTLKAGLYRFVEPVIRGKRERYHSIPHHETHPPSMLRRWLRSRV